MSYSVNRSLPLKLITVTPVSIGDGGSLSPLTDYILSNGLLYLIDEEKFRAAFGDDDRAHLLDNFMQDVKENVNKDKTEFLKDFIENKLRISYKQVVKNESGYKDYTTGNASAISTILKNGNQPFISGSTLKGALKTALLYDWLLNNGKGKLITIINEINKFYTENIYDLDEREKLRKLQLETNNFFLHKDKLKEIRSKLNKKAGKLNNIIDNTLDSFLHGDYKDAPRDFHLLQVTDSELFKENDLELHKIARFHLKKGDFDIPVFKEAIGKKRDSRINIRILPGMTHSNLKFLEAASWQQIAAKLNHFSLSNIKHEINLLNIKKEKLLQKNPAVTKGYEQFLTDSYSQTGMLETIRNAEPENAYLPLGSGKTYFYNSFGLAVYEKGKTAFERLVKILELSKPGQEFFPITRALNQDYESLGWVKLELLNR